MENLRFKLTQFQMEEVEVGLDIDIDDGKLAWGSVTRTGKKTYWLNISDVDAALWRITSSRDIYLDNAAADFGGAALAEAARGRSLQKLVDKILAEIDVTQLKPETRSWL